MSSVKSYSIVSNGIVDDANFTRKFSVSDRREIKALKTWGTSIKTLMNDIFFQGGKVYKDWVSEIENAIELVNMLRDECEEKDARRQLKTLKCFFEMTHRLLNIHEQTAGAGNIIYSLIQSSEYRLIFGDFEAELTAQSHKIGKLAYFLILFNTKCVF